MSTSGRTGKDHRSSITGHLLSPSFLQKLRRVQRLEDIVVRTLQWHLMATIGSFKVPIIYTINGFIIYFIIQNCVVQEIKNGVINGLFSINGLKGSFFVKCPLSFSFCVPSTKTTFVRSLESFQTLFCVLLPMTFHIDGCVACDGG